MLTRVMAALTASVAVTVTGCGNDKASATPPESSQSMTESAILERSLNSNMDRARADMNREGQSAESLTRAPRTTPQATGPFFYPPEWTIGAPGPLQAAAIFFYQNPAALTDPEYARGLIGLYNCGEAQAAMINEVRLANSWARYREAFRQWAATASPRATFELSGNLGRYDVNTGAFPWAGGRSTLTVDRLDIHPLINNCDFGMISGLNLRFQPAVNVRPPSFTAPQAEAFIAADSSRSVRIRVEASVPTRANGLAGAPTDIALPVTVLRATVIQP